MDMLKRFCVGICVLLLPLALMGMAFSHAATVTVLRRDTVKQWLNRSGFYEHVVDVVLDSASDDPPAEGDAYSLPADDPEIRAITKQAFSPELLRGNIEEMLNGTYAWLEGETDKPVFSIDLTAAKERLAEGLSAYAVDRARSLPACTPAQVRELASQGRAFDALSSSCLPPGVDPRAAGMAVENEILSNEDFLSDTSFNGDDLGIGVGGQQKAQEAFQRARYAPYLFGGMSALSVAGIIFLSSSRRKGMRRASAVIFTTGLLLGLLRLGFGWITGLLENHAATAADGSRAASELASTLLKAINQDVSRLLGWYALGFILTGVIGLVLIWRLGREASDSDPSDPPTAPASSMESKTNASASPMQETGTKPKQPRKIQL